MEETRALLDALMGPNRNKEQNNAADANVPDFAARTVCKNFLVGFCPHDWFSMPKRALKPCTKIHSELMRDNFERHPEVDKWRAWFEEDFLHYLQPIVRDCDAFIVRERAKCRPKSAGGKVVRMPPDVKDRFDEMEKRYADLVQSSEAAADSASLSQSKELMGQAMVLKEELDTMREKYTTEFMGEDICEVCGVKYPLGGGGAEWHDKQSHMKGKTHQGFAQIRAKVDELLKKRKDWEKYRSSRRREYEPILQREREAERPKEREKERPRHEERELKEREKPRERERSRGRDRPKPSAKEAEHRDRDRGDRDRAKERSRSRGRDAGGAKNGRSSHRTDRSAERSRSRRRGGGKERSAERSRSRRRKEKCPSSERSRSRRKKVKEKSKGARSDKSSESSRERSSKDRARRSPSFSKAEPRPEEGAGKKPPESSSDEESQPEDEKDGITVLEEDLPEFWERIQKLKAEVRTEAVAVLSTGTQERLERWLVARVRKKVAA